MRYSTTAQGDGAIDRYRRLRERCLLDGEAARFGDARLDGSDGDTAAVLSMMARRLRAASGWYDQAARAASSL